MFTLRPQTLNLIRVLKFLNATPLSLPPQPRNGFKKRSRNRSRGGRLNHDRAVRSERQHWLKGIRA